MWLLLDHTKTMLDHMGWEGEIREVKCSSTFMIGIDLSSATHGLRSLKEDCTPGKKHQEIVVDAGWTTYL